MINLTSIRVKLGDEYADVNSMEGEEFDFVPTYNNKTEVSNYGRVRVTRSDGEMFIKTPFAFCEEFEELQREVENQSFYLATLVEVEKGKFILYPLDDEQFSISEI